MPSSSAPSTRSRRTFAPVASSAPVVADDLLGRERRARSPVSSFITLVRVQQLDGVLVPPRGAGAERVLALIVAAQVALRGGRPLVGRVGLAARRAGSSRRSPPRAAPRRTSAPARPPPTIRTPTSRSAISHARWRRRRRTARVMSSSRPGSSTTSTSSPASTTVSAFGTKPAPSRSTEMTSAPSGSVDVGDPLAGGGRALGDHELDDLQPLLGQVEQVHEPVARHLVLDQAQDQVGRRDRRLDAEQLEVLRGSAGCCSGR